MSILNSQSPKFGLTLFELVLVLFILALAATIAVQSLQPVADQARYDATQAILERFDDAILTSSRDSTNQVQISGFVADIGRLPQRPFDLPVAHPQHLFAKELFQQGNLPSFQFHNYNDPTTTWVDNIRVAAGWRGPYLALPPGATGLTDGWGRDFFYRNPNDSAALPGEEIAGLTSLGQDGTVGGNSGSYDADQLNPRAVWSAAKWTTDCNVVVEIKSVPSDFAKIFVCIYGPVNGSPELLKVWSLETNTSDNYTTEIFKDLSVGPKTVRVFLSRSSSTMERTLDPNGDSIETDIVRFVTLTGSNTTIHIEQNK